MRSFAHFLSSARLNTMRSLFLAMVDSVVKGSWSAYSFRCYGPTDPPRRWRTSVLGSTRTCRSLVRALLRRVGWAIISSIDDLVDLAFVTCRVLVVEIMELAVA